VRWYGTSSDDPDAATAFAAGPHCTAAQLELNVLGGRTPAVEVCERHDLAVLGRSPLAMGLLSGRYSEGATRLPADDVRGTQPDWMKWFADGAPVREFVQQIDTVKDLLTADGRSLVQGALAWSWAASPLSIPLPGFRTVAQVESTAAAMAQGPLTVEQFAAVEAALGRAVAAGSSSDGAASGHGHGPAGRAAVSGTLGELPCRAGATSAPPPLPRLQDLLVVHAARKPRAWRTSLVSRCHRTRAGDPKQSDSDSDTGDDFPHNDLLLVA
jgi:hypothetical protein